jgi:hypothetical protein
MCYYGTFHQRREEGLWKHWANERAIVGTSGGRFSLFFWGENRPVRVLSWCYENLIGSLMYIYIYIYIYIYFGLVRIGQVIKILF